MSEVDHPAHSFDVKYLRVLYDDLREEFIKQGDTLRKVEVHMATTTQLLIRLENKDGEQDQRLNEYGGRLRCLEVSHAACGWAKDSRGLWSNVKRLNAWMDLHRQKDPDIDTQRIDTHVQRMQHIADADARRSEHKIRDLLIRVAPWIFVAMIVGAGASAILVFRFVEGMVKEKEVNVHRVTGDDR